MELRSATPEGDLLKVSEVGRRTGLTRKALRHYEAMGLVEPAVRTASGYRLYDDEALRRIELVNRAKVLGLSLVEAKEFLHVAEGCCGENHPELATLVENKLAETDQRLQELGNLRRTLSEVLDRLARTEGQHRCEESLCTCNTPLTIGRRTAPAASEESGVGAPLGSGEAASYTAGGGAGAPAASEESGVGAPLGSGEAARDRASWT